MRTTKPTERTAGGTQTSTPSVRLAGLIATCAGLVVLAILGGLRGQSGYTVVDFASAHLGWSTSLALLLLFVSLVLTPGSDLIRGLTGCVCGLLFVGCLAISALGAAIEADDPEAQRIRSPSGGLQLVVRATGFMDPVWYVSIERPDGVLSRSWNVGCFNGDAPPNALFSSRWLSDSRVRLTTYEAGHVDIDVNQQSGRPSRHVARGGC